MNQIFAQITQFMRKFNLSQRIVIIIVFLLVISSIATLILWANRPEFRVLYSDLKPAQASKIVSGIRDSKIKYQISDGGETIKVPSDKITELRLQFAESGIVEEIGKGYEVFDDQKIGMTTFMQQLNMKRALEGELVKSINKFPSIKNCRVHLVLPEEKLFEQEENGSASVVLYLERGHYLEEDQTKGIAMLVSNSVKGIETENVVIIDSNGNLLSSSEDKGSVTSAGSQWELRSSIEKKLAKKVEKIIECVVGKGNAVVEISTELDMSRIERTSNIVNPDNQVIVSEETQTENMNNVDTLTNNINETITQERAVTNYESDKIQEHFISANGTLKRISVAVLVNGKYTKSQDTDGNEIEEYQNRSEDELDRITSLVKSAVGYDIDRGDVVEVRNLQFDRSQTLDDQEYFAKAEQKQFISKMVNNGIVVFTILIAFFIIKSLTKSSSVALGLPTIDEQLILEGEADKLLLEEGKPPEKTEEEMDEDQFITHLSPEAKARLKAKEKMITVVTKFIKEHPDDASQLVRLWMTQKNGVE